MTDASEPVALPDGTSKPANQLTPTEREGAYAMAVASISLSDAARELRLLTTARAEFVEYPDWLSPWLIHVINERSVVPDDITLTELEAATSQLERWKREIDRAND